MLLYHYFERVTEDDIASNLAAATEGGWPFDVFQVDDGFQAHIGDWLTTNDSFPSGLAPLATSATGQTFNVNADTFAGAIAGVMRESQHAEVQAIGAGAVNQAVKAIVIAKGYLAEEGVNITCVPSFVDVDIDDQERTANRFVIEPNG